MAKKSSRFIILLLGGSGLLLVAAIGVAALLGRSRPVAADHDPVEPAREVDGGVASAAPPADVRCSALHYGAVVQAGLLKYKLPALTPEQLRQPLRGGVELSQPRVMKGHRAVLDTPHLRLSTSIEKLASSLDGGAQSFRADHLILSITNKSDVPVAYRVVTSLDDPEKCDNKADVPHNAIVLRPRQTIRRTECLYRSKQALSVTEVDVYEVSDLGYHYLSRLGPSAGGPFDMRVARAHNSGGLPLCRTLPWRDLDTTQKDAWRLVMDFHARHDCDEYSLPRGYRPFTRPGVLPACTAPAEPQ